MICFCYLCKKIWFSLQLWSIMTSFLYSLGSKIAIFRGFTNFFRTARFITNCKKKFLLLIESPIIFHQKLQKTKWVWCWEQNLGKIMPNVMKRNWLDQLGFFSFFFSSLNESTCQTRKNVFYFTLKALFVLEKIKF